MRYALVFTILFASGAAGIAGSMGPELPPVHPFEHAIFEPPASPEVPAIPPSHVRVTAYCTCPICCGRWADGLTAIGVEPREGWTIAADPTVFPLRACVMIGGVKMRVQDTGSAIIGPRIDIFIGDHERAKEFGSKTLTIEPWPC